MTMLTPRLESALVNFRGSELIVLPSDGEFGFQEYFDRKTELLMQRKRLFSSPEDNQLLLAYPPEDSPDILFRRFYESADIKARGGTFAGCFAVDVTDYLHAADSPRFSELTDYAARMVNIHFLFLLFTEDKAAATALHERLMRSGMFDILFFSYPLPADLADHIVDRFYEYHSQTPDETIAAHAAGLLSGARHEYEYAGRVVNELINRGCSTDPEELEKMLTEIILRKPDHRPAAVYGFAAATEGGKRR